MFEIGPAKSSASASRSGWDCATDIALFRMRRSSAAFPSAMYHATRARHRTRALEHAEARRVSAAGQVAPNRGHRDDGRGLLMHPTRRRVAASQCARCTLSERSCPFRHSDASRAPHGRSPRAWRERGLTQTHRRRLVRDRGECECKDVQKTPAHERNRADPHGLRLRESTPTSTIVSRIRRRRSPSLTRVSCCNRHTLMLAMNCFRSREPKVAVSGAPLPRTLEGNAQLLKSSHGVDCDRSWHHFRCPTDLWHGRKRQQSTRCLGKSDLGFEKQVLIGRRQRVVR